MVSNVLFTASHAVSFFGKDVFKGHFAVVFFFGFSESSDICIKRYLIAHFQLIPARYHSEHTRDLILCEVLVQYAGVESVFRGVLLNEREQALPEGGEKVFFFESFSVDGYNLCYLRPGAQLGIVTEDSYQAPILAWWQVGLGRAAAFTGEVDGKYSASFVQWPAAGELLTSVADYIADYRSGGLPDNMLLTQRTEGGVQHIRLLLDPERHSDSFRKLPEVVVMRGDGERPVSSSRLTMQWLDPDTLAVDVPLSEKAAESRIKYFRDCKVDLVVCISSVRTYVRNLQGADIVITLQDEEVSTMGGNSNGSFFVNAPHVDSVGAILVSPSNVVSAKVIESL